MTHWQDFDCTEDFQEDVRSCHLLFVPLRAILYLDDGLPVESEGTILFDPGLDQLQQSAPSLYGASRTPPPRPREGRTADERFETD